MEQNGMKPMVLVSAYTTDGKYLGDEDQAKFLIDKMGIVPEYKTPTSTICSIGFCPRDQKYYGWSHRAISGYGIGDVAEEGDSCTSSGWTPEYLAEHPEEDTRIPVGFKAKTLADAKRMAIAFADSVS